MHVRKIFIFYCTLKQEPPTRIRDRSGYRAAVDSCETRVPACLNSRALSGAFPGVSTIGPISRAMPQQCRNSTGAGKKKRELLQTPAGGFAPLTQPLRASLIFSFLFEEQKEQASNSLAIGSFAAAKIYRDFPFIHTGMSHAIFSIDRLIILSTSLRRTGPDRISG